MTHFKTLYIIRIELTADIALDFLDKRKKWKKKNQQYYIKFRTKKIAAFRFKTTFIDFFRRHSHPCKSYSFEIFIRLLHKHLQSVIARLNNSLTKLFTESVLWYRQFCLNICHWYTKLKAINTSRNYISAYFLHCLKRRNIIIREKWLL